MRTFVEVLRDNAVYRDHSHVFVRMDGSEREISFSELWGLACQRAHKLHELGLRKGDRVAIILPETDSFVLTFIGALVAGLVPVPMYPPLTLAKMDAYGETVRHILGASGARALITVPGLEPMLRDHLVAAAGQDDVTMILDPELDGEAMERPHPPVEVTPDDVAFLQFTSGSTRKPKGVMVTHHNLSHNAHNIMFDGLKATKDDRGVTWLPLFHDMGLIGFVIAPLFAQVQVMFLPPMNFIRRPYLWLDAIDRFRGTITFAPNFAYALSARAVKQEQSEKWDLSCLKAMGCGAEPIEADVLRSFVGRFAENGLSPRALLPCYGLAEATLAVTFANLENVIATEAVCPESLKKGEAKGANGHGSLELVSCGKAFPNHEIRIVGDDGTALVDGVVGNIQLRGPSVTAGYFEQPEASAEVFLPGGWLATGDLGYLRKGELFVCGRAKDLIIINGKNFYPQDIERIAASAYGVRQDQVVAFGRRAAHGNSEQCVVVAEGLKGETDTEEITRTIKQRVRSELSLDVAEVVMIGRGSMPKTSSGKVRRRETKQRLDVGTLELLKSAPVRRKAPAPRPSAPAMS